MKENHFKQECTIFDILNKNNFQPDDNRIIKNAQEGVELYIKEENKSSDSKDRLTNSYWPLVFFIVKKSLEKEDMEHLHFNEYDKLLINFGMLSQVLLPKNNQIIELLLKELHTSDEPSELATLHLTEWLGVLYKNRLGIKYKEKLYNGRNTFDQEISDRVHEIKDLREEREKIYIVLENEELKLAIEKIESLLEAQTELKSRMQAGEYTTADQKQMNAWAIEKIVELKDIRDDFIEAVEELYLKDRLREINYKIERYLTENVESLHKRLKLEHKIKKWEDDLSEIPLEKRIILLDDEIKRIKMFLQLCSKRARAETCPVLLADIKQFNTKKSVLKIITQIEASDPKLFLNVIVRRSGKPQIVIVPGSGHGVYDWENNILMIPLLSPKSALMSIVHALVEYRWDVDESGELKKSYEKLTKNKNLFLRQIRDNFFKDYILWITRECQGYKIFNKETREWFHWKIAPKDYEPMIK